MRYTVFHRGMLIVKSLLRDLNSLRAVGDISARPGGHTVKQR